MACREHRQHRVADELQHLAIMVHYGLGQPLEVGVKERDHVGAVNPVGERRRVGVRQRPDRRLGRLGEPGGLRRALAIRVNLTIWSNSQHHSLTKRSRIF